MRQKILLVVAVLFGILAFILMYQQLQSEKNKLKARYKVVKLIQLQNSLAKGETIKDDDLVMKKTEQFTSHHGDEIPWKNKRDAVKVKVSRSMNAGEILEYTDLQSERSSSEGMAGRIKIGNRAISISVDVTSSVTSLIKPEDRVDIVGTFRFPEMKGDKSLDVITMTILQSVRILATGKEMGSRRRSNSRRSSSKGYNTVTIELTPKEVEMIVFASQKGRLVLSLRSDQETGFENKLQSVNFRYLEENIEKYNQDRKERSGLR